MVLIIVLGESLISAGTGAGDSVSRTMVLVAAALGFAAAVCLWRLYFERLAAAAEDALEHASPARRARIARDAYTMVRFLLIAGVLYLALGAREVLTTVTDSRLLDGRWVDQCQPGRTGRCSAGSPPASVKAVRALTSWVRCSAGMAATMRANSVRRASVT